MINSSRPGDACMRQYAKNTIGHNVALPPNRNQAIIDTNTGLLLIEPLEYCRREMWIKWRPFCLRNNVLNSSTNYHSPYWRRISHPCT